MPMLRAASRRSSAFPWWSLGLLLGFALVILWKRLMEQRRALPPLTGNGPRPTITLEEVPATMAVLVPEQPAEMEQPQKPERKDDLRKLEGIGPKVQGLLHGAGVLTYSQLSRTSQKKLRALLESAGYGYMDSSTWPEQAKLAARNDWDGLAQLNNELKSGRRE